MGKSKTIGNKTYSQDTDGSWYEDESPVLQEPVNVKVIKGISYHKDKDGNWYEGEPIVKKKPSPEPSTSLATPTQLPLPSQSAGVQVSEPVEKDPIQLAQEAVELRKKGENEYDLEGNVIGFKPDEDATNKAYSIDTGLKNKGYNANELVKEFEDFPVEAFRGQETSRENLLKLRSENPIKYNNILNSTKTVYAIAKNSDVRTANEYNHLNNMQYGDLNGFINGKQQQQRIINETLSGNEREVAHKRLEENSAPFINAANPELVEEFKSSGLSSKINANQYAGLKTLEIFNPEQYQQAIKFLKSNKPEEYELSQGISFSNEGFSTTGVKEKETEESINYKKGMETLQQKLAGIGRNNAVTYAKKNIADLDKAYQQAQTPEEKNEIAQQYLHNKSIIDDVVLDKSKDAEKYPLSTQMKMDDQVKELTQDAGMNPLEYGIYRFGKGFKKSGNSVGNVLTSVFGSEDENTIRQLTALGESRTEQSDVYLPENLKADKSAIIPEFSKDIIAERDRILNEDIPADQKKQLLTDLVQKNQDNIDYVTNPEAGKSANFWSKATLYGNAGMLGDLASIAAQSASLGALGAGRLVTNALPMFTATQDDFYKQAIEEGQPNPMAYANTHALIMAAAGLINPKLDIVKKALGIKTAVGKVIAGIDEKTWDAAISKNKSKLDRFVNSAASVSKEAAKMTTIYGGGTSIANDLADNAMFNKNISSQEMFDHAIKASKDLALNSVALFGIHAISNFKDTSPFQKAQIWEVGTHPEIGIKQIDEAIQRGELNGAKGDQYKNVIKETAKLINKVPIENSKGKPLTDRQRADYLFNLLVSKKAVEQKTDLPESQVKKLDESAMVAEFKNGLIIEPKTEKQLESRKSQLEKSLIPEKDAEGKNIEIPEKEILAAKAEIKAIDEVLEEQAKNKENISVEPPKEIPKNIEIGEDADVAKARESGIIAESPKKVAGVIPLDTTGNEIVVDKNIKEPYKNDDAEAAKDDPFIGTTTESGNFGGIEYRSTAGISVRPGWAKEKLPFGKGYIFWNAGRKGKGGNFRELLKKKIDENGVVYTLSGASDDVINSAKRLIKTNPEYTIKEIKSESGDYFAIGKKTDLENKPTTQKDAVQLLEPHKDSPVFMGMETPEQKLKYIAEQAQGVMQDGSVHEAGSARKLMDNTFGKELVDAAIEKYPAKEVPPIEPVEAAQPFVEGKRTELSHRGLQEIATEMGFDDVTPRDRKTDMRLLKDAENTINKWVEEGNYKEKVEALVKKAEDRDVLTDEQRVIVEQEIANVRDEVNNMDVNSPDYNKKLNELQRLVKAGEATRSAAGAALRIPTFSSTPNDLAGMMVQERELNQEAPLTENQKETVKKEYEDISKAEEVFQQKVSKIEEVEAKKKAEKKVGEVKSKTPKTKKTHEDFVKERTNIAQSLKDKLKAARSELNSAPVPYAKELFAIAPDVAKLVKSYVEEGIVKLEEIVKNLHGELKEFIPQITEKDVNDLIAGEYNKKQKTKNELSATREDLRLQAKLINQLDALLSGEEPKNEKKKILRNQEIEKLKQQIKAIKDIPKEQRYAEKEAAAIDKALDELDNPKGQDEKKALFNVKKQIAKQIFDIEEQLRTGDFAKPEPKEPLKLDADALAAKEKLVALKNKRALRILKLQQEQQSTYEKTVRKVSNVLNVPRALMSTLDFSAILRQGLIPTISNPKMGFKAASEMLKSTFSEKNYNNWLYDLGESQRYKLMKESKLAVTDSVSPDLQAKEEAFMTNLVDKVPVVGALTRGSERAYSQFLNKMRVDLFNRFADSMEKRGLTFKNNPEAYKQMAQYINNSTGRGDLGAFFNKSAPILNALFFSPRLIASRLNMLTYLAQPRFYKTVPKEVRQAYFKDMASFIGVGLTVLALAKLNGADVEDDPRSADFGKIKSGNTRWDIWGGFQQYARVATQVIRGETKSSATGKVHKLDGKGLFGKDRSDPLSTMFRGKLAPVPSIAWDLIKGRNIVGEKIDLADWNSSVKKGKPVIGSKEYLATHFLPLTVTGIKDAIKDQGVKGIFTVGVPSIFGVGTQVYGNK